MCDQDTQNDVEEFLGKKRELSRRDFTKMTATVGLAMMLPPVANAQSVTESDVEITTADGVADCYFVRPASGSHAAVIVWPDILGLRPAFREMGKRLAQSGYSVLVVNPFYRDARSPVVELGASFGDPETRAIVLPMARNLNADTHFTDARAMVAWLDQQPEVDTSRRIGTTGYCMGGPMVMRTVAAVPERLGAGGTFHGGGLATDQPDSPHLLIPQTQSAMLHCVAANDDTSNPVAKETLRQAYAAADISAEIEVYADTLHGWCPPDSQVYDEAKAERAWSRLLNLFDTALA
jgi:carboxymethylenebutenolidase